MSSLENTKGLALTTALSIQGGPGRAGLRISDPTWVLFSLFSFSQFLAQLKIMDYSLLVGIHDVDRAEQEEMEVEDRAEDEECENDGLGGNPISSYGTPPDSPGNLLNYPRFFGPGEFDPSVDVYAMKSHESEYGGIRP